MKEIKEILQAYERAGSASAELALATLVQVEGSSYRRAGARMLILPDGERIGSLSGGCLEADVAERARQVCETGMPRLVCYDGRIGFDPVFETGCQGKIGILIERLGPDNAAMKFLAECFQRRRRGVLATVFHTAGECGIPLGTHFAFTEESFCTDASGTDTVFTNKRFTEKITSDANAADTFAGSAPCSDMPRPGSDESILLAAIREDAALALRSGQSRCGSYSVQQGKVQVLLESIQPPIALLLCGAGQDAIPLARFASQLGWQITLIDCRAALLTPERFPGAGQFVIGNPEFLPEEIQFDDRTAAVIMTHNYAWDRNLLPHLLSSRARYVGILGPRQRTARLLQELQEEGMSLSGEQSARLHSPVGLDLGSETPEEIALSIIAEIQMTLQGRSGEPLRQSKTPIHRNAAAS